MVLRPFARLARPALRRTAHVGWLRSMTLRVFGRNSRITSHARLFLFGAPQPPAAALVLAGAPQAAPEDVRPELDSRPFVPVALSARERLVVNALQPTCMGDRQSGAD